MASGISPSTQTRIEFDLPEAGSAQIVIRGLNGQVIYQYSDTFNAGRNQIQVHKRDLQEGVLFYTLIHGSNQTTKRMIVID